MSEKRLGKLTEQELTGMMDFVLSAEFDQMPADEFFGTLKAMDDLKPYDGRIRRREEVVSDVTDA